MSNHRSLFDDPGVVSCLLPLPIAIQPRYNRWALCSQEYCFNGALPGLVHGYIGAGQVLPIRRGGGIDQRPPEIIDHPIIHNNGGNPGHGPIVDANPWAHVHLHEFAPKIVVVGVGGAGTNAVNNMVASGLAGE